MLIELEYNIFIACHQLTWREKDYRSVPHKNPGTQRFSSIHLIWNWKKCVFVCPRLFSPLCHFDWSVKTANQFSRQVNCSTTALVFIIFFGKKVRDWTINFKFRKWILSCSKMIHILATIFIALTTFRNTNKHLQTSHSPPVYLP